jgi:hypothetical protein
MGIIVTSGDSFTYGDELEGSRNSKGFEFDTHHPFTFTHQLSEMLDKKYLNLGKNGSSNSKIYRDLTRFLQTTSREIDLIVVTWSNFGRFEIANDFFLESDARTFIKQEDNMNQIIPSHKTERFIFDFGSDERPERKAILKQYIDEVLTLQTQIVHSLTYMRNIQFLCDTMGIKVMQGIIHRGSRQNLLWTLMNNKEGWDDYKNFVKESLGYLRPESKIGLGEYIDIYSLAEQNDHRNCEIRPGGHVCEKTHYLYAEMLHDITKDKGWFGATD